jgi:large subunit ribosomal protein L25
MQTVIKAALREGRGKEAARRLRKEGKIPAVLYGHGFDAVSLAMGSKEFSALLRRESGIHGLVELRLEGKKGGKYTAVVKEIQRHPLRNTILHVDFQKVKETERIHAEVPLRYVGEPVGVRLGGILQHFLYDVRVECLPGDLPEFIEVDISKMKLGQSLKVADLPRLERVSYMNSPDEVLVSIITKRVKVAGVAMEEEAEGAEGAEGAAPPEKVEGEASAPASTERDTAGGKTSDSE